MIMILDRILIFAFILMLVGTWNTNFGVEGEKIQLLSDKPTDLTATAVSPTQINLSWKAPTQNYGKTIMGYKIEHRLNSGIYDTVVENTANTITAFSITGLTTGNTYVYRVSAVYSDGQSTDPSIPSAATPDSNSTNPFGQPLSSISSNEKFDFVPPDGTTLTGVIVSQIDYQDLQYKKNARSEIMDVIPTTEPINNNRDGLLIYQNNHLSPNDIPAPLTAKAVSPTQIKLAWLPPLESYNKKLQGYKIELKRAIGDFETIDDNTGNYFTEYSATGLTSNKTYTYRVSAVYSDNTHSNTSNEASAITLLSESIAIQNPKTPGGFNESNQVPSPSNSQPIVANNIKFNFIAPDGVTLSAVILTQSDYQQLILIKDPRSIISNVTQTENTINNSLSGLLRYQEIHIPARIIPQQSNNTPTSTAVLSQPDNAIVQGVVTYVLALLVVGGVTWFAKTKLAKKLAKEYHFTLEKYQDGGLSYIRIRNSGDTIENCVMLCEKETCVWTDTLVDSPRHVYEGSISNAKLPEGYENKNSLILVKSGKKILRKTRLEGMAQG